MACKLCRGAKAVVTLGAKGMQGDSESGRCPRCSTDVELSQQLHDVFTQVQVALLYTSRYPSHASLHLTLPLTSQTFGLLA